MIDEAYADFADENSLDLVRSSKTSSSPAPSPRATPWPGCASALAIARPEVIAALDKIRDHYNLDRLAQAACVAALQDQTYFRESCRKIIETRDRFSAELAKIGYHVIPSSGNDVFATPPDQNGARIYQGLYERRILVRHFATQALPGAQDLHRHQEVDGSGPCRRCARSAKEQIPFDKGTDTQRKAI